MFNLDTNIQEVPGVGEKTYSILERSNILTIKDILELYPRDYLTFKQSKTSDLKPNDLVVLMGNITKPYSKKANRISIQTAFLTDQYGRVAIKWFNQPYITRTINPNENYLIQGKVDTFNGQIQIVNPKITKFSKQETLETEKLFHKQTSGNEHTIIEPIYQQIESLKSSWFKRTIYKILDNIDSINETIPLHIIKQYNLIPRHKAIINIHKPANNDELEKAIKRLSFEELYQLQLNALKTRQPKHTTEPLNIDNRSIQQFISSLPFKLTNSQINAINEISHDLSQTKTMNRLLMGDVGSGKTIVATIACYISHLNKKKSFVMAPTQVLAEQLYKSIKNTLSKYELSIELITGTTKPTSKNFDILVGTHAILNIPVPQDLGILIIDEQHKFGVKQREKITKLSPSTHKLTMTATPIPRTLALTTMSHTDISYLTEKPSNRKPTKTYLVPEAKRQNAYRWMKQLIQNEQYKVFFVAPLIEDSEYSQISHLKSATELHKELKSRFKSPIKISLLHGNMKESEKQEIVESFKNGDTNILVSTTVIEVGIDIPDANIIVIESAERFGLSQLHQLRGRVGRSSKQGYCLLFTTNTTEKSRYRLEQFVKINDGFKLAELDLKLRGPGEIWGTRQHGFFNLKLANIFDKELVEQTHNAVKATLQNQQYKTST